MRSWRAAARPVEPSGTVRVDEKEYRGAVEQVVKMREEALRGVADVGGTGARRGLPALRGCGQASVDDGQQELMNRASFVVPEGGTPPADIQQRLEARLDRRWARAEGDGASVPVWRTSTPENIELRLKVVVRPSQDSDEPGEVVSISVTGSCMRMSKSLRDKVEDESRRQAGTGQL